MKTNIINLLDFERINSLLEGFNKTTGFVTAILDLEGNVLSKSGWRSICTEFHRINQETAKKCTISDTVLANKMASGEKYQFYKCLNGLVDVAVPLIINGEHVGNLFSGQFFFKEPDRDFFIKQAKEFGFDEIQYLKALESVPVFDEEQVRPAMDFLLEMTGLIAEMTMQKMEQIHLNEELRKTKERTEERERILKLFVEHSPASIAMFDNHMHYVVVSKRYLSDYNLGNQELIGKSHYDVFPEISPEWKEIHKRGLAGETIRKERDPFIRSDESIDWVRWEIRPWYEYENKIGGIILFSEVITEHIEIESNLILAQEQLSQILNRISDGFGSLDKDWNYTYVNDKLAKNVGKDKKELLGKNIWEVFPEAVGTPVYKAYHRAMEEQVPIDLEHYYPHFGRWFQHRFYPSENGLSVFSKDITESKQAEEKIKENSALIRIAAERAKLGGWNVDLKQNRSYWSDEVAAIHEMPSGYAPLVEDGINFYAPEWRDKIKSVFTNCAVNGVPYDEEMQIITSSGKRVWVRTIGEAVRDEAGKIFKVQGAFQDISDKKLAEEKSREKDLQFRKLSSNVPDLLFQFTRKPDGTYCVPVASEGIKNIFGCTPEDVLDDFSPIGRVIYPDDAERVIADIEYSAKHLTYFTCEFRVLIPGRPVQWIFSRSSPERLPDGSITWYGFNANITERKLAEEKINTLNQRLEMLVEAIKELSISSTMDGIIDIVRFYTRKLVNADGSTFILREGDSCFYAGEDTISPLWKGQYFSLSDCISGWAMLNKQTVIIEDIYSDDRIPIDAYKSTYVKSLAISPIRISEPLGAIGAYWANTYVPSEIEIKLLNSLSDSAAKAVENVQLIEGLEQKISERTSQLQSVNKELETFTYSVSHDLKAPLRGIDGYSKLLNDLYGDKLNDEAKHFIETIRSSTIQMNQLIEDLLQYSRLERSNMQIKPIKIKSVIDSILKVNEEEIMRYNFLVNLNVPDIIILADSNGIQIALRNLIENAIKFTKKSTSPEITINLTESKQRWIFEIIDNGIGFDMKYSERIFEIFQRLQRAEDFPGTGIGLAMVAKAVQRMNGSVSSVSAPGNGSTFYLEIPKSYQLWNQV